MSHFPDMRDIRQGRDIILAFDEDIGNALKHVYQYSFDEEAMTISRAARLIRRKMLKKHCRFEGKFEKTCQKDSVSKQLVTLVEMILSGVDIDTKSHDSVEPQISLSIAQLLQFNCIVRRREGSTGVYHSQNREPPLPIYLGLLLHAETRKRGLVDKMYDLGLSISYDRVLSISSKMGNIVAARFEHENVVCPPVLQYGIFTTSAVDNIDHNPSSTSAQGAFHGTGISLFQHRSENCTGRKRDDIHFEHLVNKKSVPQLPYAYSSVQPAVMTNKHPAVPIIEGPLQSNLHQIPISFEAEYRY